jgi:hypothetical protein
MLVAAAIWLTLSLLACACLASAAVCAWEEKD